MQRDFVLAFAVCALALSGADAMTKDEFNMARAKISADYKVARAKCEPLNDNAKDVCEQQAKGSESVAKAELQQVYRPSNRNAKKVAAAKAAMAYQVAKEKCDDLAADAKRACVQNAQAGLETAEAKIKRMKGYSLL